MICELRSKNAANWYKLYWAQIVKYDSDMATFIVVAVLKNESDVVTFIAAIKVHVNHDVRLFSAATVRNQLNIETYSGSRNQQNHDSHSGMNRI